ncbi:MAG: signal peptidase I [Actinobacteria bacterium]|nr:signal peptidase I [Actinomycetota bacterium]
MTNEEPTKAPAIDVVAPPHPEAGRTELTPVHPPEEGPAPGDDPPIDEPRKKGWRHGLAELPVLIVVALVIAVIIKSFIAQAFYIPSASMYPTLRVGDRVLVEKIGYRFGEPSRGDVVVFARDVFGPDKDFPWYEDVRNFARDLLGLPTSAEEDYIKRVVAVGGDVISYTGSPRQLRVNGEVVEEPWVRGGTDNGSQSLNKRDCERLQMEATEDGCLVPEDDVFVMGDNRSNSEDSRVIGPIHKEKIVGRAFAIAWPPSHLGGL